MPENDLPRGWTWTRVDQAGLVRLGRQRSPDKHTGRFATKYVRAANITVDGLDLSDLLEMDFTPAERAVFRLQIGDVLLTEASGSAAQVGRAVLWSGEVEECCYQNTVVRFRPHITTPAYALLVFRHYAASGAFARAARGVGIQHLGASRFAELPFPLPPLTEQSKIAKAVDTRLAEIREAAVRLRSALTHLGDQTREILAAAAAGELVESAVTLARREGRPVPDATEALAGAASSDSPQANLFDLPESSAPLTDDFKRPLPQGWMWARMDQLGEIILGRQRAPKYQHGAHLRPYLRVANVLEDRIDTSEVFEMNFEPDAYATYVLAYGDILLNEGQSPELVGRPALFRDEVPGACFQNHLIRFRARPIVEPEYALLVFRHYLHSGVFRKIARWSTNIATLGVERFRALPFPLPPLEEQTRIVAEANRRLGTVATQVAAVEASLERLPEMERELLAAAVAGELIPQNPDDEPAAALVARLGPPLPEPRPASTSAESETGEIPVTTKRRAARGRAEPTADLAKILREAGRPLPLPELFGMAGYDRDQPEQVELFYLALRTQLGHAIRQTDDAAENGSLEAIDAAE